MDRVLKLLDDAKLRCGAQTDSDLAKCLKVTRQAVSNWRAGAKYPDAVACARLAELTERSLAEILGIVGEARAKSSAEKSVWRRLAATAAAVLIALGAALPAKQALAAPASSLAAFSHHGLYIMRIAARWLLRAAQRVLGHAAPRGATWSALPA